MEYYNYMDDEKWKRSSKELDLIHHSNHSSSSSSSINLSRSISHKNSSSSYINGNGKSPLLRSFSHKNSSSSSSSLRSSLPRSCSTKCTAAGAGVSSSSEGGLSRSNSSSSRNKCSKNFGRKCTNLAKEQRAKFYIVKRCITMLVCWNKHGDS